MELELEIIKDPCRDYGKSRKRVFGARGGTIGRATDSYWVLPDPKCYLSSRHCEVSFRNNGFWLRDVSRNGVVLNDEVAPIERGRAVPLRDGDRIRLAQYEISVKVRAEAGYAPGDVSENLSMDRSETRVLDEREAEESEGGSAGREEAQGSDWASDTNTQIDTRARRLSRRRGTDRASRSDSEMDHTGESPALQVAGSFLEDHLVCAELDPVSMEKNGILLGLSDNVAMRAYKILRTRLRKRLTANHWRSVAVTGAGEGVGKTVTAINLGIAFAQDTRSPVFLVDLDLYRPQIANYLGIKVEKGLSDYLLGEAELGEIVYSTGVDGFAVIPNQRPLENSSELLGSERMAELAHFLEIQQPERVILYDMPPLLMSDDVLVFSSQVDCLLDVVAVGVTPRASLERSREILSEFNVVGVVLNRATERDRAGHYYYY